MIFAKKSTKELVQGESGEKDVRKRWKPEKGKKEKKEKPPSGERTAFYRTKTFWGVISMLLGLGIAFAGVPMLRSAVAETEPTLCFAQDVRRGTLITADLLTVRDMSTYHMPAGTLRSAQAAIGRYVAVDALAGDVVTDSRLSSGYPGADPQLADLPEGMLAVSVSLPDLAQSVSGKLRQGDVIQLFAVEESNVYTAIAPPELQYLEVLAVTCQDGTDVQDRDADAAEESDTLATVTLLANVQQAAMLAGLDQNASLHAALAVRGNESAKAAALEKQRDFFTAAAVEEPAEESTEESTDTPAEDVTIEGTEAVPPANAGSADANE